MRQGEIKITVPGVFLAFFQNLNRTHGIYLTSGPVSYTSTLQQVVAGVAEAEKSNLIHREIKEWQFASETSVIPLFVSHQLLSIFGVADATSRFRFSLADYADFRSITATIGSVCPQSPSSGGRLSVIVATMMEIQHRKMPTATMLLVLIHL